MHASDTIVALSTPPGMGGIGVVRVSGPQVPALAVTLLGALPAPRHAQLAKFTRADREVIDEGIALYYPAPASFTGEHVLELQGHGGVAVCDMLVERVMQLGARMARPGEFTERAFLNDKLDLAQAEAVADLIGSATQAAARSAMRSLQGEFSQRVTDLADRLGELRVFVEADLDFPDEELDLLSDANVANRLTELNQAVHQLEILSARGVALHQGLNVVLAGAPNAGKSSLLNRLIGDERAIVSAQPGTTRDAITDQFQIRGLLIKVTDTAGLRVSDDDVEQEGVRRASDAIVRADLVVAVVDDNDRASSRTPPQLPPSAQRILVLNKCDLSQRETGELQLAAESHLAAMASKLDIDEGVAISALTGEGIDALLEMIYACAGLAHSEEPIVSARARHVDALARCRGHLSSAERLLARPSEPELIAEELRLGHEALGEIVGRVSSEDLLGQIFAGFCIGK